MYMRICVRVLVAVTCQFLDVSFKYIGSIILKNYYILLYYDLGMGKD